MCRHAHSLFTFVYCLHSKVHVFIDVCVFVSRRRATSLVLGGNTAREDVTRFATSAALNGVNTPLSASLVCLFIFVTTANVFG